MAITFIQQKKRQRYFVTALLVVVAIGALFFGSQFLQKGTFLLLPVLELTSLFEKDIDINFEILDTPVLQELGSPPESIPLPEPSERVNPFVPL
ncbi:hypothetical protein IIA94_01565 [Patescibacteria group bacterium]|nr:hypothetical protein [Patescibacteria group bacterium]